MERPHLPRGAEMLELSRGELARAFRCVGNVGSCCGCSQKGIAGGEFAMVKHGLPQKHPGPNMYMIEVPPPNKAGSFHLFIF